MNRVYRKTLVWFAVGRALGLTLLVLGLLAGCATPRHLAPTEAVLSPEQWFEAQTNWRMDGRIALSDGESGGQMSMRWQQATELTTIDLRAGLGGQSWRLVFDDEKATLEETQQRIWSAEAPEQIVYEATGWPIPIRAFGDWIKGLPSSGDKHLEFDGEGRLVGLVYEGWTVELSGYEASWGESGRAVILPSRFEFQKEPYRVRVVLNRWEWPKIESDG